MKRFYTLVSSDKTPQGFEITLDGRPIKTPFKNVLTAPHEMMANEIVQEWSRQDGKIVPDSMPFTQLLSTKIDQVTTQRETMRAAILRFLNTDLICYPAQEPEELAAAQDKSWAPWRTWFTDKFGENLKTTTDLRAIEQSSGVHSAVRAYVDALDDDHFTVFQLVTPACGSIILAMAFTEGAITAQQVFDCARVEEQFKAEIYNEEKYGPDPAEEEKDKAMLFDLEAAQRFLKMLKS